MKKKSAKQITPEDILANRSPEVRTLAEHLRRIVRETVPEAEEAANPGWRSINYRHPGVGYFCGIFPEEGRVRLAFEFGILLPDPYEALSGSGKQVRYVDVEEGGQIPIDGVKQLLQAAISLPEDRGVRLTMVKNAAKWIE
jgi:hypothetical protein